MHEGLGVGAAQVATAALTKAALNELDVFNARSIKLAEATRVRLFLPGLKGGPLDEWEDPQDARAAAAAQAAAVAARGPTDTALKSRKKLAKVAALAHANDAATAPAGGASAAGAGGTGEGEGVAAGGMGMGMVVEAIIIEEDDDDDVLMLANGEMNGEGGMGAGDGSYGGPGGRRVSGGLDGDRPGGGRTSGPGNRYYGPGSGAGGMGGPGGASAGGAMGRGGGGGAGGGRHRPGSATGSGTRPSSAALRRAGDGHAGTDGGSHTRLRTGAVSGSVGGVGGDGGPRVPVWTRLAANAAPKEKAAPPPPKVYRAVQGKTLSLGLGGPDDGLSMIMVADPAAPYYGVEPGNGSGAVAAAAAATAAAATAAATAAGNNNNNAGRLGWPVIPPVNVWGRGAASGAAGSGSGTAAAPAAAGPPAAVVSGRGSGGSSYGMVSYDAEYGTLSTGGARRPQEGIPPAPLYGNAATTTVGPNVAFVRSRRLGSGASPGKAAQPPSAVQGPASPATAAVAADRTGSGGSGSPLSNGLVPASTAGASAVTGVPGHRVHHPRTAPLHRVTSEIALVNAPGSLSKVHSSELSSDAILRATATAAAAGNSWGSSGGGPGPPAPASPSRLSQAMSIAVPTAWAADAAAAAVGGGVSGSGMSYNAMRAVSFSSVSPQGQVSPGRVPAGGSTLGYGIGSPVPGYPSATSSQPQASTGTRTASYPMVSPNTTTSGGGAISPAAAHLSSQRSVALRPPPSPTPAQHPFSQPYAYPSSSQPQPPSNYVQLMQQQPQSYLYSAAAAPSNGYSGVYPGSDGYVYAGVGGVSSPGPGNGAAGSNNSASRYGGNASGLSARGVSATVNAGGTAAALYSTARVPVGTGPGLLFASGSTPQVTVATLAAVAAAAGAVAATTSGGGASFGGGSGGVGIGGYEVGAVGSAVSAALRMRSSSYTQLAQSRS